MQNICAFTWLSFSLIQGDSQRNLFIIKQGHCDAVTEDLSQVYRHLLPGDYFGEESVRFAYKILIFFKSATWNSIVLFNVFTPTRNAQDLIMHRSIKEHTNTWKNTRRCMAVSEKYALDGANTHGVLSQLQWKED